MVKLISDSLNSAICEQISHEQYNSSLYLYVCGFLKNKGFDNLAKHFETQWQEEIGHSKVFFDLLTDLNSPIIIPQVDEISIPLSSISDVANTYLNREVLTTNSINEIKKLSIGDDNPVVEERMREMIKLQQNEYEEATTFLDNATLCGDDWWKVKVWNDSIK
jgi:ferritin